MIILSWFSHSLFAQTPRAIRLLVTQIQIQQLPEKQGELSQYFNFFIAEKLKLNQGFDLQIFNTEQALSLLNQEFDLSQCELDDCAYRLADQIGSDISLKSNLFLVDGKYHLMLSLNAITTPPKSLAQVEVVGENIDMISSQIENAIHQLFKESQSFLNAVQKTKIKYRSVKHATAKEQAQWTVLGIQWVKIEGGELSLGSELSAEESPVVKVQVPHLLVMKNEVTVSQYFQCVSAMKCTENAKGEGCYALNAMDQRPVNCVTWEQAKAFSDWIGARLPSEAEWEWIAKGKDQRKYPWGDDIANCNYAVMKENDLDGCGIENANVVCSKPRGNTPEGICDLGGNVWEWVEDDWFQNHQGVKDANARLKKQSKSGDLKVYKGGSWYHESKSLRNANRGKLASDRYSVGVGFRCVF